MSRASRPNSSTRNELVVNLDVEGPVVDLKNRVGVADTLLNANDMITLADAAYPLVCMRAGRHVLADLADKGLAATPLRLHRHVIEQCLNEADVATSRRPQASCFGCEDDFDTAQSACGQLN